MSSRKNIKKMMNDTDPVIFPQNMLEIKSF